MSKKLKALSGFVLSAWLCAVTVLGTAGAAQADHIRDGQYWLKDYGIERAWEQSKGAGVKVAVLDTGIDDTHPDLRGVVVGGRDFSKSGNAKGTKPVGPLPDHGTLVATLLAGRGNNQDVIDRAKAEAEQEKVAYERALKEAKDNDEAPPPEPEPVKIPKPGPGSAGVIGVAPEAELLSASLWLGSDNPAGLSVEEQIPRAVRWAVDRGAKVINMSLGSTSPDWPVSWDAAFKYAEEKDVVVVVAAGNRDGGMSQVGAPATIPGVLTVAGVDKKGKASVGSSTEGISIGVSAPAEPLVGGLPGGGYADWSGTSGAAPLVSGVVALIRSKYPEMKAPQVIHRVLATAKDAGAPGVDNLYGHGLLDADAAVNANVPEVAPDPANTMAEWIRVHRRGDTAVKPESSNPAIPSETSTVPPVAAPAPVSPEPSHELLPASMVLGLGGLLAVVGGAGGWSVARTRRKLNRVAATTRTVDQDSLTALKIRGESGARDIFDDLPEHR